MQYFGAPLAVWSEVSFGRCELEELEELVLQVTQVIWIGVKLRRKGYALLVSVCDMCELQVQGVV